MTIINCAITTKPVKSTGTIVLSASPDGNDRCRPWFPVVTFHDRAGNVYEEARFGALAAANHATAIRHGERQLAACMPGSDFAIVPTS